MQAQWRQWLDRLLMADLFLVLGGFLWLAVSSIGRSLDVNLGFELWLALWEPLFQPAIGILMLGAIASGIAGWISRRFGKQA
ncbi:MAG: hypothetical protein AAFY11_11890 [Cyanobacteria bacterium J06641_5]